MRNENTTKALQEHYRVKREETISKVKEAINEIRQVGGRVTIKELEKVTGLSNAVFYKPHIQVILSRELEWNESKVVKQEEKQVLILGINNKKLNQEVEIFKSRIQDLKIAIERKDKKIEILENDIDEKEYELQLLRGKYHALLSRVEQEIGLIDTGYDII
jgi:chromosome segregation ATPase